MLAATKTVSEATTEPRATPIGPGRLAQLGPRLAGDFGDDRVYILRRGVVRASFPYPATPIEHEAFRAVMAEEISEPPPAAGPLPLDSIDEVLLMMAWFRAHPDALRRTTPYEQWM